MVTIRQATEADTDLLTAVFVDAFDDDPIFRHFLQKPERRQAGLTTFFRWNVRQFLSKGTSFVTEDDGGAMVWAPPDEWRVPIIRSLPMLPAFMRSMRLRTVPSVFTALSFMEHLHEQREEVHWYLPTIGVRASAQGQGYGGALLDHMLERVDGDGLPAYLEASTPRSRALYRRHGFEDLGETHLPGGGPPFWPMWRPAR